MVISSKFIGSEDLIRTVITKGFNVREVNTPPISAEWMGHDASETIDDCRVHVAGVLVPFSRVRAGRNCTVRDSSARSSNLC